MAVAASRSKELRALASTDAALEMSDANEDNSEATAPVAEVKRLLSDESSLARPREAVAVAPIETVPPAAADNTSELSDSRNANSKPSAVIIPVREL